MLIKNLNQEYTPHVPIWLMRQAGRYLPEYRELRKEAGSFLNLCYNPEQAAEVTLQPIRRFNFDAAILFSDILVIPNALGMDLKFVQGEGPVLTKLKTESRLDLKNDIEALEEKLGEVLTFLNPIFNTVENVRQNLDQQKALIGFCGAPWTVALYMIDNMPSKSSETTRKIAYQYPDLFDKLMDILVESSFLYLSQQIEKGADVVQIFDSWASQIPDALFERALVKPTLLLCRKIKEKHPETPIIIFPRGLSEQKLLYLVKEGKGLFNGLSLDYTVNMPWACDKLQDDVCLQGNLDPVVMLTNPEKIIHETQKILEIASKKPGYIFNFGHGILPSVPVENVKALVEFVQNWEK